MNKKLLLSLGTIAATTAPIATTIACSTYSMSDDEVAILEKT